MMTMGCSRKEKQAECLTVSQDRTETLPNKSVLVSERACGMLQVQMIKLRLVIVRDVSLQLIEMDVLRMDLQVNVSICHSSVN